MEKLTKKKILEILQEYDKKNMSHDYVWPMGSKMYKEFKKKGWIDKNNNLKINYEQL